MTRPTVVAVCGKGGAGKTAFSALLARVLCERRRGPLLLVDADPARGLTFALGEQVQHTLASVRDRVIETARHASEQERARLADDVDYFVAEALVERPSYSLLAMGCSKAAGCFCPANKILRHAIDLLAEPFEAVIIDAEAGIEQINRRVTRRVTHFVAVDDGSRRSRETVAQISRMVGPSSLSVVHNRHDPSCGSAREVEAVALEAPQVAQASSTPRGLGSVPEDPLLRGFDQQGRALWELPASSPALQAVRAIAGTLDVRWGPT